MINSIKARLWDLLKKKEVSLVMIYHHQGEILWHKGRAVLGKSVFTGEGFCGSVIQNSIKNGAGVDESDILLSVHKDQISDSAKRLMIKSILIQSIGLGFYLYVDSGVNIAFSETERELIKMMGSLLGEAVQKIRDSETGSGGILGESPGILRIKELVLKYSLEDDCVLMLGETGVGKSHVAELIHKYSGRKGEFVVADTTTINENLFESEIFGHKKGAFTGAISGKRGLVDEAANGTLFFDEIAEVPVSFQTRLLRFIDTKKFRVLGDPAEKTANVRIVAATNRDLKQMIKEKKFREDLYYRLNIFEVRIPPLRDRKEDIKLIISKYKNFLKGKETGRGFWHVLGNHDWPGNLRELFTVIKRAGVLCDSPISGKDIQLLLNEIKDRDEIVKEKSRIDQTWKKLAAGKSFWEAVKEPFMNRELNRYEVQSIISNALNKCGGKYIDTLELFNLSKSQYKKFMKFLHSNKIN